ncbi:MAG: FKBP-type peptidyl-prolyl cis-trans isomerase [Reinekea sp.]
MILSTFKKVALSAGVALAITGSALAAEELKLDTDETKASYGIGYGFAQNLMGQTQGIELSADALAQGIKDAMSEAEMKVPAKKDGVTTTDSGLQYEVMTKGDSDEHPSAESTVQVHYHGTLIDGTVFDSSVDRGEPIDFPLNGVIAGWTEGVQLMSPGDKYRFFIPADLAYGDSQASPLIPPGSTLIFEVELLDIL